MEPPKAEGPVIETPLEGTPGSPHSQEIPDSHIQPNIQEPKIDFQKDTFEIDTPVVKEPENPPEVDFSRPFPSKLSLEIQNHLEKSLQEVFQAPTRWQEREGILEAEKKIRYKILEQEQPKSFRIGIPVVKPRRVIVRRKKVINPARRIPKYIPKIDGGMWKVWGYPEVIELSTSSSEEVVEIPEGVELDQDGYPLLDPDKFDFTTLSPKWLRVLGKLTLYLLQSVTGFFMVKYAVKLWRSYTKEAYLKHSNKPPNLSETSEDSDDSDKQRDYGG